MEAVHHKYGIGHKRFELADPSSSVRMDKHILYPIHIISFVYGGNNVFNERVIAHSEALKMYWRNGFMSFIIGCIHSLRNGNERHYRALFRAKMNMILVRKYVQLRGCVLYALHLRNGLFHRQYLVVHRLTAYRISTQFCGLLHGHF